MKIVKIDNFRGEYSFLSNFYPCEFEFDGEVWKSSEHAFISRKALDQPELFKRIQQARTPSDAKKLGKSAKLPKDWDVIKLDHMLQILRAKFSQNQKIRQNLIDTWPHDLIEGNTWGDKIWGCIKINGEWFGQNNLGKTLMKVRQEFLAEPVEICVSGPRPQNLGCRDGFSKEVHDQLYFLAEKTLKKVYEKYPNAIVRTGLALGFDQAFATAAYALERPFKSYIPGRWQPNKWSSQKQKAWENLIAASDEVIDLDFPPEDFKHALMERNSKLIEGCSGAIVLDLGSSGTKDTINKLEKVGIKYMDLSKEWLKIIEECEL